MSQVLRAVVVRPGDLERRRMTVARNDIAFSHISVDGFNGRPVGAAGRRVDVGKNGSSGRKVGI